MQNNIVGYKYELINYFDVWYNKDEGYSVNNQCSEGEIYLSKDYDNKEILKTLKEYGFLKNTVRTTSVDISDWFDLIEIFDKKGCPICALFIRKDVYQYEMERK